MKVLMFGWEYPPHVFGGLATANLVSPRACMPRVMLILHCVCLIHSVMRTAVHVNLWL